MPGCLGVRLELRDPLLAHRAVKLVVDRGPDELRDELPNGHTKQLRARNVPPTALRAVANARSFT